MRGRSLARVNAHLSNRIVISINANRFHKFRDKSRETPSERACSVDSGLISRIALAANRADDRERTRTILSVRAGDRIARKSQIGERETRPAIFGKRAETIDEKHARSRVAPRIHLVSPISDSRGYRRDKRRRRGESAVRRSRGYYARARRAPSNTSDDTTSRRRYASRAEADY